MQRKSQQPSSKRNGVAKKPKRAERSLPVSCLHSAKAGGAVEDAEVFEENANEERRLGL